MRFEWNPVKAEQNLKKHKVAFEEAVTVFYDPLAATFDDSNHTVGEYRHVTVGYSSRNRLLVVAHAERGENPRIISARVATGRERKKHEG